MDLKRKNSVMHSADRSNFRLDDQVGLKATAARGVTTKPKTTRSFHVILSRAKSNSGGELVKSLRHKDVFRGSRIKPSWLLRFVLCRDICEGDEAMISAYAKC